MNIPQLRPHQEKAINAVLKALERGQKRIIVEMPSGCGKSTVLAKIIESVNYRQAGRTLVVADNKTMQEQLRDVLFEKYIGFIKVDKKRVEVETEQSIREYPLDYFSRYQTLVLDTGRISGYLYETSYNSQQTVIAFLTSNTAGTYSPDYHQDVVFAYTYEQAIIDGVISVAMEPRVIDAIVEMFGRKLLSQFGYTQYVQQKDARDCELDFVVEKEGQTVFVECKRYKSQVVSPTAANTLLSTMLMRRFKQRMPHTDSMLLIIFNQIPSFQKDIIYDRHGIIVWDIDNLIFYCKNNPSLLKLLTQITYFPIDGIEGKESKEAERARLFAPFLEKKVDVSTEEIIKEATEEADKAKDLISRLKGCKTGQKHSGEYEDICEEIIRTVFEVNYFNRLTSQHRTKDKIFRMDLIGTLKIDQDNGKHMHPFWQMLVQHYNSHFVVFEFKNYADQIDQNLIYITEKYLFNAALRNVAIIISRKGFSKSAKFAAEGCLKEHGKLILDVNDEDLIKMLQLKSDGAADLLLEKLEDFLMSISK